VERVIGASTGPPGENGGQNGHGKANLKRTMGLWMATALVIGNMVGSGIFLLPAALADEAGPISLVAFALTGIGAVLLALVFANLGRAFPKTGGPYAYARRAFGDFIGFQTAWGYWIAAWVGNAAITVAFVSYLAVFWPRLGGNDGANWTATAVGIGLIWLLTFVNVLGVREAAWTQVITTILKFVPLAAIGVIGLFYIDGSNFEPFAPSGIGGGITAAAALTLWAFIGLESATVPADELKDPKRTIPRSTIIGTVAATIVYIVATVAIMGIIPAGQLAGSGSPFADAAETMWGGSWGNVIAVVALISTFGVLNGWILLQARIPLAAAEDGLFPKQFAVVHGKRRTPVFGLVASSLLMTALMLFNSSSSLVDQFEFVILLATLTTLVPYAFSAGAQLMLFVRERELFSGRRFAKDSVIALLAFTYSMWAIWGSGEDIIAKGFMLLTAGVPIYVVMRWMQRRDAEREAAALKPAPEAPKVPVETLVGTGNGR
jgi:APA family basic amino acid/polyamine antiporter